MGTQRRNSLRVAKRASPRRNPARRSRPEVASIPQDPVVTGPKFRRATQKVKPLPNGKRAWRKRSYVADHEHHDGDDNGDSMDQDNDSADASKNRIPRARSRKRARPLKTPPWHAAASAPEDEDKSLPPRWGRQRNHGGDNGDSDLGESELELDSDSDGQVLPSSPDTFFTQSPKMGRPRKAGGMKVEKRDHHDGDAMTTAVATTREPDSVPDPVIPDWQGRLEYFHWVRILSYAAAAPGPFGVNARWLVQTACVCKALAEPAMTVLYRRPPLHSEQNVVDLVQLLRRPPSRLKFNYRPKIRSLYINIAVITLAPDSLASPMNLIRYLPLLSEIQIISPMDAPPYRSLEHVLRWQYSQQIFEALEATASADASSEGRDKTSPTRLESWTWNERMMTRGYIDSIHKIQTVHDMSSFASLRKIQFVNFQIPSWKKAPAKSEADQAAIDASDTTHINSLAEALSSLKQLEHVIFESSTLVNATLLPLLPHSLKHFELINCWEVTSADFANFLLSHGHHMESLTLHHNQSLDLSFLTVLGLACPKLKELRMNLLYYRHHEAFNDSDPFYDHLLLQDQVPVWPPSLQVIDLEYLRQWSPDAADMFFQSLADNAKSLPDLRHLSVKGMLNIPWRQRSEFRRQWQEKLSEIYLRPVVSPKPLRSVHQYPKTDATSPKASKKPKNKKLSSRPSRQSNRLASLASDPSHRASGKARRLRSINRTKYEEPDSDEFDQADEYSGHETISDVDMALPDAHVDQTGSPEFVEESHTQRMCNVVEINIDNQKPREHRYNMDDFLNSEGDETDDDWNGANEYE